MSTIFNILIVLGGCIMYVVGFSTGGQGMERTFFVNTQQLYDIKAFKIID